jgi:hypothetical protein
VQELRDDGMDSLHVAAKLHISLKKVNEVWKEPEELPPDEEE